MHDYQAIIFGYHANKEHPGMSLKEREGKNPPASYYNLRMKKEA